MNLRRQGENMVVYGITRYAQNLGKFIISHDLPADWFDSAEHIGVSCKSDDGYFWTINNIWKGLTDYIAIVKCGKPRTAIATLSDELMVIGPDPVKYVEIKGPGKEADNTNFAGIHHVGFFYPHFEEIRKGLEVKGLDYIHTQAGEASYINVVLDGHGQQVEFSNNTMWSLIRAHTDKGELEYIWSRP